MTASVRLAGPSDSPIVARLLAAFNREFDAACPDIETLVGRFTKLLLREDVLVLLAEAAAQPVGFAYLTLRPTPYYDGPLAQLEELYVQPELRDQGIGTLLLTAAIREVRKPAAGEMYINVDEIDEDTRRFYERHGFVNIEPGEDYRMLCYLRTL